MTSLRWTALLLPLSLLATGCEPAHDEDQIQSVAVTGDHVVVTARTTSVGGYGCGGLDEGTPALFVSADAGRNFDRLVPTGGRAIDAIGVRAGTFYVLRSSYDGFAVESSPDGVTWTERATGTTEAHDLLVDAGGVHVAHLGGILTSPDGLTWTNHAVDGNLYSPRLARVADRFILATGDGAISTSADGATWSPRTIATVTSVHRLAATSSRALAIAHADRSGSYGSYLVAFDPAVDTEASFTAIDEGVMAVVDAPAGTLIGDGTLAPEGVLEARRAHTSAFQAGAVDGQRVLLAGARGVSLSTDGGNTFAAPTRLPLAQ